MAPTLVTGPSRGIGRAIADLRSERGHQVIGLARTAPGRFRLYEGTSQIQQLVIARNMIKDFEAEGR